MSSRFDDLNVADGDLVQAKDMPDALTAATLHFRDGATQLFTADGKTTYLEQGRSSQGGDLPQLTGPSPKPRRATACQTATCSTWQGNRQHAGQLGILTAPRDGARAPVPRTGRCRGSCQAGADRYAARSVAPTMSK